MLARALYDPPRGFRHARGDDGGDGDPGLLGEAGVVGGEHGCALGDEGHVECWGLTDLALEGSFVQLTLGQEDVCGLTAGGSATCGNGTGAAQPPDGLRLQQVSCGSSCCGVTEDLTIACWGDVWR